ncbi:MAG: OmpA family protein [Myxococcales bacterium]|nr:OmpA family protein [Myxococcales bacterium]
MVRPGTMGPVLAFLLGWGFLLGGCTQAASLQGNVQGVRELVVRAEQRGAYSCAPRELAIAKAHLNFAQAELDQGNLLRAREHLAMAEPNGRAALSLSPPGKCNGSGDKDGDGIPDDRDKCPLVPEDFDGVEDEDGCPDDSDTDGDGVVDSRDACMLEPEDTDGYLDLDGCPEPDNDLDAILDERDNCANEAEDHDDFEDDDGCPDLDNDADTLSDVEDDCPDEPGPVENRGCPRVYKDVVVTKEAIRISQKIYFEFNKATLQARSYPILNTVAQVLKDYPKVTIDIQGHTDSRGSDKYNMKLSSERAASVRAYLLGQGIDPNRMTSTGYGETRPVEPNTTAAGREANRRVEFLRTDKEATAP